MKSADNMVTTKEPRKNYTLILMLAQRLRRWPNIETSSFQRVLFAEYARKKPRVLPCLPGIHHCVHTACHILSAYDM